MAAMSDPLSSGRRAHEEELGLLRSRLDEQRDKQQLLEDEPFSVEGRMITDDG